MRHLSIITVTFSALLFIGLMPKASSAAVSNAPILEGQKQIEEIKKFYRNNDEKLPKITVKGRDYTPGKALANYSDFWNAAANEVECGGEKIIRTQKLPGDTSTIAWNNSSLQFTCSNFARAINPLNDMAKELVNFSKREGITDLQMNKMIAFTRKLFGEAIRLAQGSHSTNYKSTGYFKSCAMTLANLYYAFGNSSDAQCRCIAHQIVDHTFTPPAGGCDLPTVNLIDISNAIGPVKHCTNNCRVAVGTSALAVPVTYDADNSFIKKADISTSTTQIDNLKKLETEYETLKKELQTEAEKAKAAAVAAQAKADAGAQKEITKGSALNTSLPVSDASIPRLIGRTIKQILGVTGAVGLAIFIYGGFVYLTSGGSQERIGLAKKVLTWSTLGLVVIFAAYAIVDFIITAVR